MTCSCSLALSDEESRLARLASVGLAVLHWCTELRLGWLASVRPLAPAEAPPEATPPAATPPPDTPPPDTPTPDTPDAHATALRFRELERPPKALSMDWLPEVLWPLDW